MECSVLNGGAAIYNFKPSPNHYSFHHDFVKSDDIYDDEYFANYYDGSSYDHLANSDSGCDCDSFDCNHP